MDVKYDAARGAVSLPSPPAAMAAGSAATNVRRGIRLRVWGWLVRNMERGHGWVTG
jgi:hypothetical protein